MTQPNDDRDLEHKSIDELVSGCQQQLNAFRCGKLVGDSTSCTEIVRRAAAGDGDTQMALWTISKPMVERICAAQNMLEEREFIFEEVRGNFERRLLNRKKPFEVSVFADYRTYLKVSTKRVISKFRENRARFGPLEDENIAGAEKSNIYNEVELALWFSKLLERLDDELEREAFRRHVGLEESSEEITAALRKRKPDITVAEVYRLIEYAKRRLRNDPFVKHLRQDLQ